MLVAVVGCTHGEVDAIYTAASEFERVERRKIDLILCCGDFQAVRNEDDLRCLACPPKYRSMNNYYRYYKGEIQVPIPTIFVGGNHEASNHLQELPLGGLVAPNIYYLGTAGVVQFKGLRIAGLSGIYVAHDYEKPKVEAPPYPGSQLRSVYHVRKEDVDKLMQLQKPLDIFIGHDWPQNITDYGNLHELLQRKPFLKGDIKSGRLGSPAAMELIKRLKPKYHFAAHMHAKFSAVVKHDNESSETRFLALNKPLPGRDFFQVLEIPTSGDADKPDTTKEAIIHLDSEWLSILRREAQKAQQGLVSEEEMKSVEELFAAAKIPMFVKAKSDFQMRARPYMGKPIHLGKIPEKLDMDERNQRISDVLKQSLNENTGQWTSNSEDESSTLELNAKKLKLSDTQEVEHSNKASGKDSCSAVSPPSVT